MASDGVPGTSKAAPVGLGPVQPLIKEWGAKNFAFLSNALVTAHENALAGTKVTFAKIPHGNASIHFAALLHAATSDRAEDDAERTQNSKNLMLISDVVESFGKASSTQTCSLAQQLVKAIPIMSWAPAVSGSTGVFDLATILVGLGWNAQTSSSVVYKKALCRLQAIVVIVNHQWILNGDYGKEDTSFNRVRASMAAVLTELDRLGCSGNEQLDAHECLPAGIRKKLSSTLRDVMPTPATAMAIAGPEAGTSFVAMRESKLTALVKMVHGLMMAELTMKKQLPTEEIVEETGSFVYMLHMRAFLWKVSEQLELTIVRCDRLPALGPWYALIILAVRSYAMAVASVVVRPPKGAPAFSSGEPSKMDDVVASYWMIRTLALNSRATGDGILPPSLENLLCSPTRSSYERMGAQDGSLWVLCRAAFSGVSYQKALALSMVIHKEHGDNKPVMARFGALCMLMHTQTAVAIMLHDPEAEGSLLTKDSTQISPMFSALCFLTMPSARFAGLENGVGDQSIFEVMSTFVAGTSDLEFLCSDEATFSNTENLAAAWKDDVQIRKRRLEESKSSYTTPIEALKHVDMNVEDYLGSSGTSVRETATELTSAWVQQFHLVALEWMRAIEASVDPSSSSVGNLSLGLATYSRQMERMRFGFVMKELSTGGVERRLQRVAASGVQTHCARWLEMAFSIAVKLKSIHFRGMDAELGKRNRVYLIKPPQHILNRGLDNIAVVRDAAWLELNVRLQAQRVMKMARYNGQFKPGNHVVLVGWFSTATGPKIFARAITAHTIRNTWLSTAPDHDLGEAWLLSDKLVAEMRERGEEEIMCVALKFVEELHKHLKKDCKGAIEKSKRMKRMYENEEPTEEETLIVANAFKQLDLSVLDPSSYEGADEQKLSPDSQAEMRRRLVAAIESEDHTAFHPRMLNQASERRDAFRQIHGSGSWYVPEMDNVTLTVLTGLRRAMADPALSAFVHTTQSKFEHGVSIGAASWANTPEDFKADEALEAAQARDPEGMGEVVLKAIQTEADYASMDPHRGAFGEGVEADAEARRRADNDAKIARIKRPDGWTCEDAEEIWIALSSGRDFVTLRSINRLFVSVRNRTATEREKELVNSLGYDPDSEDAPSVPVMQDSALRLATANLFAVMDQNEDGQLNKKEIYLIIGCDPPPERGSSAETKCSAAHLEVWRAFHDLRSAA